MQRAHHRHVAPPHHHCFDLSPLDSPTQTTANDRAHDHQACEWQRRDATPTHRRRATTDATTLLRRARAPPRAARCLLRPTHATPAPFDCAARHTMARARSLAVRPLLSMHAQQHRQATSKHSCRCSPTHTVSRPARIWRHRIPLSTDDSVLLSAFERNERRRAAAIPLSARRSSIDARQHRPTTVETHCRSTSTHLETAMYYDLHAL
mmetsp:Transcript_17356/g.30252  ORF Transcript_17356/g.30252 Transcript_17356/m.30252 type:complete len:208 (-) Transcript_17356:2541-3164(-)